MKTIICEYCSEDITAEVDAEKELGPHLCDEKYIAYLLNK